MINTNRLLLSAARRLLSIIFIASVLISCEFESDKEFFRDIEKPSEIMVGLDLAGVNQNEPIYIYDDTKLYYTLNSAGKKLLDQEIMINNEVLHLTGGDYIMIFKDNLIRNGTNTLKITFRIKTDSDSLADIMNAEYYEGDFIFQLVPVDNDFDLGIREGITSDDFFMLEWDRPSFAQLEITSYEIKFKDFRGAYKTVTLDGSATSFVDKDYVGGYRSYSITMKFKGDKIKDKTVYYNMSYSGLMSDDIIVEFKDLVSTTISWKQNRYNCKYFILHNRNDEAVGSTSYGSPVVTLEAPYFPEESGYYTVIAAPYDLAASEISYKSGGVEKFYEYKAPQTKLDMSVYSFSVEDMLIYGLSGNSIKIGDATTLNTISSYNSQYFENISSVSVSPNSSKLLVFIGYNWGNSIDNKIYLYDNKENLSGIPKEVESPKAESRYQRVDLIDDDLIFIANSHQTDGVHSYYSLINANTGDIIETLETNIYNNIDLSYDRKRLAVTDRARALVNIYDIGELGFELYKTISIERFYNTDDLLFCVINPLDSDQVILWSTTAKEVLVLDVSSERHDFINGRYEAIDPFTGRLYCFDADWDNNGLMNVYNSSKIAIPAFSFRAWPYGLSVYEDFILTSQRGFNISNYFE